MHASEEQRKDIFFLRANDVYFRPNRKPVGKNIATDLNNRAGEPIKFTSVELGEKRAYFIIAAPST